MSYPPTPDEVREHVETDLSNAALQDLINDANAEIAAAYGADGERVEWFTPGPADVLLFASRPVDPDQPVTVESYDPWTGAYGAVAATDYALEGTRQVRRLTGRPWGDVRVTYTPVGEEDRRRRVLIDLVRLAVRYEAAQSSGMGDVNVSHVDYERERTRLLRRLGSMAGGFA